MPRYEVDVVEEFRRSTTIEVDAESDEDALNKARAIIDDRNRYIELTWGDEELIDRYMEPWIIEAYYPNDNMDY